MKLPGAASLYFLLILLVLIPLTALRSAQRLRRMRDVNGSLSGLSRERILLGTLFLQAVLLCLAWFVGRGFGYQIFALPALGLREILAAAITLALCLGLRAVARWMRGKAARRSLFVYQLAPRTKREWWLWTVTVVVASVAEEAAYRGVGMSILWYSLGNPSLAAIVCAAAFALAHSTQGWPSTVIIFAMGLLMHGLVALTGTLVLAMGVHLTYDVIAGWLIAREAREGEVMASAESASPGG